jgi:hypothetical protein
VPPWQMRPLQARPLLRLGDDVVVLDERHLVERVTRGLYWLVHDHEKETYGDKARGAWTQVWSGMAASRAVLLAAGARYLSFSAVIAGS